MNDCVACLQDKAHVDCGWEPEGAVGWHEGSYTTWCNPADALLAQSTRRHSNGAYTGSSDSSITKVDRLKPLNFSRDSKQSKRRFNIDLLPLGLVLG